MGDVGRPRLSRFKLRFEAPDLEPRSRRRRRLSGNRRRPEAARGAGGVLRAVADLNIAHSGSLTRPCVTVSVGVATVEPGGDYSHEHAVREADIALYAVKSGGRDGWSFLEPLPAQAAGRPDAGSLLQSTG